jgi:hypothetical protein
MSTPQRVYLPRAWDADESSAALGIATELGIAAPQANSSKARRAIGRWLVFAAIAAAVILFVFYIALLYGSPGGSFRPWVFATHVEHLEAARPDPGAADNRGCSREVVERFPQHATLRAACPASGGRAVC